MSTSATTAKTPLSEQVAEEIRVAMLRRRITGARLATELGVSPAWVSYRLSGKQPIDLNDLQRIADVLDVEVVALLPGGGGPLTTNRLLPVTERPKPHRPTVTSNSGKSPTQRRAKRIGRFASDLQPLAV